MWQLRSRFALVCLLAGLLLVLVCSLRPFPGAAQDEKPELFAPTDMATCQGCHGEQINEKHLRGSAHGTQNCQSCHKGINQFPHPDNGVKKPSCVTCHPRETEKVNWRMHHKGKNGHPAACATCHGNNVHAIPKITRQAPTQQQAICQQCHAKAVSNLRHSVHGSADLNCLDCHGVQPKTTMSARPSLRNDAVCDKCHHDIVKVTNGSVHAQGGKKGMTCLACHGGRGHSINIAHWGTPAQQEATCMKCHPDVKAKLNASVHGGANARISLNCVDCHGTSAHAIQNPKKQQQVAQTADALCARCHSGEAWHLAPLAHGQAAKSVQSPLNCQTCHGGNAHSITLQKVSPHSTRSQACLKCHQQVADAIGSSAHGGKLHSTEKALPDCITCHGASVHGVMPAAQLGTEVQDATCIKCHAGIAQQIANSVHGKDNIKFRGQAPSCVACHGGSSHRILPLAELSRDKQEKACKNCHANLSHSLKNSVHDRPDKVAGDHPTCLSCHGGKQHQIMPPKHKTPQEKAVMCGKCHSDAARMGRYGLTTEAFTSYEQTFHGKALLRFNKNNSANCTDCHGLHGVLSPNSPDSPTHPDHVVATCAKCHPGAKLNFAMSGANHLRTHINKSPLLHIEELAFLTLIWGSMTFLLGMVALDLRTKVLRKGANPESGKPAAWLIAISFFALVGGILLAYLRVPYAWWAWVFAAVCLLVAFICYQIKKRFDPPHPVKQWYLRMSRIQRVQHILLAGSFTVLVLTGFPLRFAEVGWMHYPLYLFGGFEGARIIHRIAGVMMVVNWIWHLGYLLVCWKRAGFTFSSWTMWPRWKDVTDLFDTLKYGFGFTEIPPQYTRFQFREKFDYFADMWGTIVMGFSGFMMWFPTELGNQLPSWMFGFSYIAHSYEGLLAMMAIIVWHFYNVHFNPDAFPMNPAWLTGYITDAEMARDHPIEKRERDMARDDGTKPAQPTH